MTKNIVFLDSSTVGNVPNIHRFRDFGELKIYDNTLPDQLFERTRDADIIITNKVMIDREIMNHAKKLKLICIAATGMNNVDLEYARKNKIPVINVENYSTYSVTQSTFSMLLYLLNHARYYDEYVKSGSYAKSPIFTHHGRTFYELKGKVYGIIGLGNIGKSVAKLAEAFGCRIIYYSTSGKNIDPQYRRVELDKLLTISDIISIHAPLNEKTRDLISYKELIRMKSHAILINVGRGGIVNEKDLAKALDGGIIFGAGIDVLSNEPIDENNPLLDIKNKEKIYITPHVAWASLEARTLLIEKVYENIKSFIGEKHNYTS